MVISPILLHSRERNGGDGACEIIYVEELEILQRGNPTAYVFAELFYWLSLIFGLMLGLRLLLRSERVKALFFHLSLKRRRS